MNSETLITATVERIKIRLFTTQLAVFLQKDFDHLKLMFRTRNER